LVWGQSLEGFIPPDLVLGGHLEGANWSNLAIGLNGIYHIVNSIDFGQFFWWHLDFLLLTNFTVLWLSLFSSRFICFFWWGLFFAILTFFHDELPVWDTKEETCVAVNPVFM
jgi:hypothetical protein